MLGRALSVFSEPGDFQAALREVDGVDLVVTGAGQFWARLSRISLFRTHLFVCEERLSRIAFISVPAALVRVALPPPPDTSLMWNGIGARPGEIVTHGGGHRFHERTDGPIRWSTMWLRARHLATAVAAARGGGLALPPGEHRWRPTPVALNALVRLHRDAIRVMETGSKQAVERETARVLEQKLVATLVECLVSETTHRESVSARRHAEIMIRFEDASGVPSRDTFSRSHRRSARCLGGGSAAMCTLACLRVDISISVGWCGPSGARNARRGETTVVWIAQLHGFAGSGSFSAAYRSLFGELPSTTLRGEAS